MGYVGKKDGMLAPVCAHCGEKPRAFLVVHHETSTHWRCLKCFRDLAKNSHVIVLGVQVRDSYSVQSCPSLAIRTALSILE